MSTLFVFRDFRNAKSFVFSAPKLQSFERAIEMQLQAHLSWNHLVLLEWNMKIAFMKLLLAFFYVLS